MSEELKFPLWTKGSRKESTARVRVIPGSGRVQVNNKSIDEYFGGYTRAKSDAAAPLQIVRATGHDFHINVSGGGISGQAGAVKLGLARALSQIQPDQRPALKKEGFLTRDPRMVERKKPGQPKARRRFQHSKR